MRYKPKNVAALHLALAGLPDRMGVTAEQSTGVSARTVGELRKATTWPENLAITTPLDRHSESVVTVSKVVARLPGSMLHRCAPSVVARHIAGSGARSHAPADRCFRAQFGTERIASSSAVISAILPTGMSDGKFGGA
jgi:hypothetical protein